LISIILIFLVHHLIHFFKSTLTVPKVKDLVNTTTQKYDHIYNTIQHNNLKDDFVQNTPEYKILPRETMKNELKSFLKKQMKDLDTSPLENFTETNENLSYSMY